ncbi:MAG: RDD family protein [Cytophagales bacterium]|nr:MAG: RDD family protein [Cytophagales bacterium]
MEINDQGKQYQIASLPTRIINYVIDQLVFFLLIKAHRYLGIEIKIENLQNEDPKVLIYLLVLSTCYYFFTELFFSKSIGKFITKTRVVNDEGEKPSIAAIAIRSISRNIPLDNLSFLIFSLGWHDQLSKTRVVHDSYVTLK